MKYPSKVITIEAISDKPEKKKAAIKGNDGNWYETFRDWQGEIKLPYSQLISGNHNEPFKKGDTVKISYQVGEFNGKPQYQLMSIYPSDTQESSGTANTSSQEKLSNGEAPTRSQSSSNDQFGKRLALHGFVNAMLSNGATIETIIKDLPALGKLGTAIDRYLNEPQALTQMREKFGSDEISEPSDSYDESVEDVPF
jgi:hypothetical protein